MLRLLANGSIISLNYHAPIVDLWVGINSDTPWSRVQLTGEASMRQLKQTGFRACILCFSNDKKNEQPHAEEITPHNCLPLTLLRTRPRRHYRPACTGLSWDVGSKITGGMLGSLRKSSCVWLRFTVARKAALGEGIPT